MLPESSDQASKYVREAVVAYSGTPLGNLSYWLKGHQKRYLLPRIASAINLDIDKSFVCVVPLVLSQLGIGICLRKGPIAAILSGGKLLMVGVAVILGQGQIRRGAGAGTTGRAPATGPGGQKLQPE